MEITKADKWFSIYIRLRDSDDNGICKCITCGTMGYWKEFDNGHYVKRQHIAARFNEINCNAQCKGCNWLKQGNDAVYEKKIIEKYGQASHDLLKSCERKAYKYSKLEIDILAKEYQAKAKELAKQKGIKI